MPGSECASACLSLLRRLSLFAVALWVCGPYLLSALLLVVAKGAVFKVRLSSKACQVWVSRVFQWPCAFLWVVCLYSLPSKL